MLVYRRNWSAEISMLPVVLMNNAYPPFFKRKCASICVIEGESKVPHCVPFKFASGEGSQFAVKTRATGCLRLSAPFSFARLARVPIKSASGASGSGGKRKAHKGTIGAEPAFGRRDSEGDCDTAPFGT